MKPIAILGSGPAGLLAAYAVGIAGRPLSIFASSQKSELSGAQFLHRAIYGLHDEDSPDAEITYRVRGDAESYQRKVYGDLPVPFVSFGNIHDGKTQPAWNLLETYDYLWGEFGHVVNEALINPQWIESHQDQFDGIISTVPAPCLCAHRQQRVPTMGEDPTWHQFTDMACSIHGEVFEAVPDNTIVYDGTEGRTWYRSSLIFGVGGTEWGPGVSPPVTLKMERKPIATNCDCFPDVVRLGRKGTWTKGVLTHQAFFGALQALAEWGKL